MSSSNSAPSTSQTSNVSQSYSDVLSHQSYRHPKKDQAIVFNAIEGARLQDYLLKLGPIVNPKNIIFCSRIANNRICVYLSSKDLVNNFMDNHGEFIVNGENIKARRLITPSERLIISNVCPTIPHTLVKDALQQIGLKLISPISFLRIGAPLPEYNHILSFRRQVYITPDDTVIVPVSLEITHENLTYRIFLSLDNQKCYKCKLSGHVAAQCNSRTQTAEETPTNNESTSTINHSTTKPNTQDNRNITHSQEPSQQTTHATPDSNTSATATNQPTTDVNMEIEQNTLSTEHPQLADNKRNAEITTNIVSQQATTTEITAITATSPPNKRTISDVISPTSNESSQPVFTVPRSKTKKHKTDNEKFYIPEDALEPIKKFSNNRDIPLLLNTTQLKSLLENVHGSKEVINIVSDYTTDYKALIEMLILIYPHINDKTLKNRCTRLRKKLENYIDSNKEALSDTSSVESTF
nr:unnamed protein product [Callosobruchus chinensis]